MIRSSTVFRFPFSVFCTPHRSVQPAETISAVQHKRKTGNGKRVLNHGLIGILLALLSSTGIFAQSTTKDPDAGKSTSTASSKPKVLFVPFNVKMYMSEIDMSINKETNMNYHQIRDGFRSGLMKSLMSEFRKNYNVVSLLDDTVKMKKDLAYVYEVTTSSYEPVGPATAKKEATAPTTTDGKNTPKTPTGVKKGQIEVQTEDQDKFMATLILSPNLLGYLKKKYNADYVVFISELDLKNELGEDPYNMSGAQEYKRSACVHYTVVSTATSKRIAAGKAKSVFSSTMNKPQKIIDNQFSAIAKTILAKLTEATKPK